MPDRRLPLVLAAGLLLAACTPPGLPAPLLPSASASASAVAPPASTLVIGVDQAPTGFNPHTLADFSPAAQAVDALVLPSVSSVDAAGRRTVSADLVDSAEVTSRDPFTVTYRLDRRASWSDGTPITAADFSYLRDALTGQPGTVDPAGYRLITAIRSVDAGKTVEVEFSQPVADWLSLFSPLLPAHIMKDSPGGWSGALAAGVPVSGNRYKMVDLDSTTGEVTLARNDKFWGTQPGPASVVLRVGSSTALLQALDRGDLQAALVAPAVAASLPADRRVEVGTPGTVQLVFDTRAGATADQAVRRAVALGLDQSRLRADLAGATTNPAAALDPVRPVVSQVRLPADASGQPGWGAADVAAATAALQQAGYRRAGVYQTRDGRPLRITLRYATGDARAAAAAADVQDELGRVGIEVDLAPFDTTLAVVQRALGLAGPSTGGLSLLFVARPSDDVLAAAAAFGCPAGPTPAGPSAAPTSPAGGAPAASASDNLSGYCDSDVQAALTAAIASGDDAGLAAVDTRIWSDLPVLPLVTPVLTFAVGPRLAPVVAGAGPGWTWTGALAGLPSWPAG